MYTRPNTSNTYALQAELLVDILSTQKAQFIEGISEYELIEVLKTAPYCFFDKDALQDPLMLFKTHFILFHALYQLKRYWLKQNIGVLEIHALCIKLTHVNKDGITQSSRNKNVTALNKLDPLAEYYLDWANFDETDREAVDMLLNSFWQKMSVGGYSSHGLDDIKKAHTTLGLSQDTSVTLVELKRVYKRKLQFAHPDKGGTQQEAQSVIHAYQVLSRYYSFK